MFGVFVRAPSSKEHNLRSAECEILSKHFSMSASSTYLLFLFIELSHHVSFSLAEIHTSSVRIELPIQVRVPSSKEHNLRSARRRSA